MKKAISLKYDKDIDNAPKVTAKGQEIIAQKIIDIAKEHNIPIKKDPDLTHMLFQLEINQEIPAELYKAVAEIFAFVYDITKEKEIK